MDDNKIRKINKTLTVFIAILIIIIILLLLKGCSKKDNNISHKGKINVFEIKCDTNCECEKDDNNNTGNDTTESDKNKKSNDKTKEVIKESYTSKDNNTEIDINVLDNYKTWQEETDINIFDDSTYVVKGKIAPESAGTYQFVIKNSTSYNVEYDVKFEETNNYHVNMKYRLKKNNDYLISDWVSYSELSQEKIKLNSNSTDTYYLEWKWFSSSNDNSVGSNINSKYGLSIDIKAVQKND